MAPAVTTTTLTRATVPNSAPGPHVPPDPIVGLLREVLAELRGIRAA